MLETIAFTPKKYQSHASAIYSSFRAPKTFIAVQADAFFPVKAAFSFKGNIYHDLLYHTGCGKIGRKSLTEVVQIDKLSFFQDFVVQFVDYFEGEQQSVILTEYLEGGELFQRISSADYHLTEAKCRDFTRQILKAIDFIHSKRIIHLDLKPQNIVLSKKAPSESQNGSKSSAEVDKLKIIDFGLARALGPPGTGETIPINMCGTLEFMSPEVMRCSHASPASDMWSLGVIMYMMVSGGLSPFWGGNEYRTQRNVLR